MRQTVMISRLLQLLFLKFNNIKIKNKIFIIMLVFIVFSASFVGYSIYVRVSEIIINNSLIQIGETIKQTKEYINEKLAFTLSQFSSLELDKEFLRVSQNRKDDAYVREFSGLTSRFEQIRSQNSSLINNIFFYRYDRKVFYEYTSTLNTNIDYTKADWYQAVVKNGCYILWYKSRNGDIFKGTQDERVFSIMKEITDMNMASHGILVFDLKEKFLKDILVNLNKNTGVTVFIVDEKGNVISGSMRETDTGAYSGYIKSIMATGHDKGSYEDDKKINPALVIYDTIQVNKWKIIAVIPSYNLTKGTRIIKSIALYIVLISILLSAVFAFLIIRMITSPINKLAALMKKVKKGDFGVKFQAKYNDEIGLLGQTFNDMIDGIKRLIAEVKEEKQLKMEAELKALQAQINPHFLYNTLDSVYWMAKNGNRDSAAEMAAALASLFRLGLNKGYDMTTVERETEHVKNYLMIEKLRYEDKFEYSIEVDTGIYRYKTLKLILQPLVENAILHGIYEKEEQGFIRVKGRKEGAQIVFEVIDNGVGMDVEKVKKDMEGHLVKQLNDGIGGYALSNVYSRIKMKYKDEGRMEFFSVPDVETRVVIYIPAEE